MPFLAVLHFRRNQLAIVLHMLNKARISYTWNSESAGGAVPSLSVGPSWPPILPDWDAVNTFPAYYRL